MKRPRRVLLVEDDQISAAALSTILRRRGFEVLHALTVADGLKLLAQNPETLILDLMLPDGDGAAVLRHLRSIGSAIQVIVTTASNDRSKLEAVRSLNPDAVMQKPIDLAGLLSRLDRPN